jgi:hypothetical protein
MVDEDWIANWLQQVLLAIMSGVFGLAGWHFCKPPPLRIPKLIVALRALHTLTLLSAFSHQRFFGAGRCQSQQQ